MYLKINKKKEKPFSWYVYLCWDMLSFKLFVLCLYEDFLFINNFIIY